MIKELINSNCSQYIPRDRTKHLHCSVCWQTDHRTLGQKHGKVLTRKCSLYLPSSVKQKRRSGGAAWRQSWSFCASRTLVQEIFLQGCFTAQLLSSDLLYCPLVKLSNVCDGQNVPDEVNFSYQGFGLFYLQLREIRTASFSHASFWCRLLPRGFTQIFVEFARKEN